MCPAATGIQYILFKVLYIEKTMAYNFSTEVEGFLHKLTISPPKLLLILRRAACLLVRTLHPAIKKRKMLLDVDSVSSLASIACPET